jgi:hypothetical protein
MDPLFFAIFLGVLHGADPGRGWLFAVYSYVLTKDRGKALLTLSALWGGHSIGIMATYLAAAPLLGLRHLAAAAVASLSAVPLIHGKLNPHGLARPWSRTSFLAISSALAGFAHGGGLVLAAICGLSPWAYLAHVFSVYLTSGIMAAVFAKSLTALKKIYINFDYLYAATGVATAIYLVAGLG